MCETGNGGMNIQSRPMKKFSAVILAGDRIGCGFAQELGVERKVLAPLAGRPMLLYVLDAITLSDCVDTVYVVANRIADIEEDPAVRAYVKSCPEVKISFEEGCTSPSRSVAKIMQDIGIGFPMLLTTGDHPLLTAETVREFCKTVMVSSKDGHTDFFAGLATRTSIRAMFPDVRRTFYVLNGEGYSGSNLFALMTPVARDVVVQWGNLDSNRKKAWRMVAGFGPGAIFRYLFGRLSLANAMQALTRSLGAEVDAVILSDGKASMDVDRREHYDIAERLLMSEKKTPA